MPYHSANDLPGNVRNVLPKHAQEIYLAAFNNAWDEYKDPEERRGTRVGKRQRTRSPGRR